MIPLKQKFRILRQRKNVNQKAMATLLKISIPAYSKLETGLTDPNFNRIMQIAQIHNLTVKELLDVGEEGVGEEQQKIMKLEDTVKGLENTVIKLQAKLISLYDRHNPNITS